MSGDYGIAVSINGYFAIVYEHIPILAFSDYAAVGIYNFLLTPAYNIVRIQTKIAFYSLLS
jgi:hypothetical protein